MGVSAEIEASRRDQAALLLAAGRRTKQAAAARRTILRRTKNKEFTARVTQLHTGLFKGSRGVSARCTTHAASRPGRLLESKDERVALPAAPSVLGLTKRSGKRGIRRAFGVDRATAALGRGEPVRFHGESVNFHARRIEAEAFPRQAAASRTARAAARRPVLGGGRRICPLKKRPLLGSKCTGGTVAKNKLAAPAFAEDAGPTIAYLTCDKGLVAPSHVRQGTVGPASRRSAKRPEPASPWPCQPLAPGALAPIDFGRDTRSESEKVSALPWSLLQRYRRCLRPHPPGNGNANSHGASHSSRFPEIPVAFLPGLNYTYLTFIAPCLLACPPNAPAGFPPRDYQGR
jgi:hypothetical protein